MEIQQLRAFNDNYIYLIHDPKTGSCAAVDPADPAPVLAALDATGWKLDTILITHHHPDHVGGNQKLKAVTGCRIVGAARDAARIPGIDLALNEGDTVDIGSMKARVIDVSGHTTGHIAFWFEDDQALFSGDSLFALGCGRLFEGSAADMWASMKKLRDLPDATRVFCAHEYTQANAAFAKSIEPDNAELIARAAEIDRLRAADQPTVPSTLGQEKATNPFLRADVAALQTAAGLNGLDPVDVFAEVRRRKDHF